MKQSLWRFENNALQPAEASASEGVELIDSFAVRGGKTVALDLHRKRFAAGVAALAPTLMPALPQFWTAVANKLSGSDAFPRVELVQIGGARELRLRARPLGQTTASAGVHVGAAGDPRRQPRLKGPDLPQCQAWQAAAQAQGYDEYLICDDQGMPLEGAYSALLWWQGDAIAHLHEHAAVLPSVTQAVVLQAARERGLQTVARQPTLAELQAAEVWLLNARHGIRVVSAWSDGKPAIRLAGRREIWQKRWLEMAQSLA